jgi:putative selenium metabolism hydrolase
MVYGGAILKHLGLPLKGDLIVAARVLEHAHASVGMRYLVDKTLPERKLHFDFVVMGNPTNLDVYLGHRGRVEIEVLTIGRTSHAGAPWLSLNAVYHMVPVIQAVQELNTTLPSHPFLEKSSLALTNITATPEGPTAVPDHCTITLDRRFLPSEDVDEVVWQVQSIVNRLSGQNHELKAEVRIAQAQVTSYTGLQQAASKLVHPFVTESGHALVGDAVKALESLGQAPRFGKWGFTTEGGYTGAIKKITTIGYAPGDEKFAHTPFDRVSVSQLVAAAAGYAAIARGVAG